MWMALYGGLNSADPPSGKATRGLGPIDGEASAIRREVRVVPNRLRCAFCDLSLPSYQDVPDNQAFAFGQLLAYA